MTIARESAETKGAVRGCICQGRQDDADGMNVHPERFWQAL